MIRWWFPEAPLRETEHGLMGHTFPGPDGRFSYTSGTNSPSETGIHWGCFYVCQAA
jgi:hypothetical protein